jgi:UDP-N-acetylglucosamine 2-epimerase
MAGALAAFHARIPVAHVEAGLRSGHLDAPFPEEMNRVVIDRLATHLFPPTPRADAHLAREGVAPARRLVTGNTSVDALLDVRARLPSLALPVRDRLGERDAVVLVTAHRRESFGAPLRSVFEALLTLAGRHPDVAFVYPVHPNPQVHGPAYALLRADNIVLVPPVGYAELVWLMDRACLVLSDSGGVQEEAPTLGRPLLVLRNVTERPEVVDAGAGRLVGTDRDRIVAEAERVLCGEAAPARPRRLFGDGRAAERIAARLAGDPVQAWAPEPAGAPA